MSNDAEDTQPRSNSPELTQPTPSSSARPERGNSSPSGAAKTRRARRQRERFAFLRDPLLQLVLILGSAFLLLTLASGAIGWGSGRSALGATATIDAGFYMFEQYNLALADIEAGNYALARQRLEFIFVANPSFLDVADKWVEVSLVLGQTSAPTSDLLTPSLTPTEDPRPKEELLLAAKALIAGREWTAAIDTLLALRKADAAYQGAEVDGMLYLALRNRGVQNIIELGLFEQGLYDFSLAQKFGPIDGQALNYQEWARLYLYGNAFWFAYPQEAAYYYGQLINLAPDLRDSSGLSAFYRYRESLLHYADQLMLAEDWCAASEQYAQAQAARDEVSVQPTAAYALEQCILLTPSATFTASATGTSTPSATWTLSLSETPIATGSSSTPDEATETFTETSTASETVLAAETETPSETATETPTETTGP